ncbi:MAG: hypothetical protein Q3983_06160 [Capnocytophaga sp.]|nr:hypothetical protein [Capnocytophaga sp.]
MIFLFRNTTKHFNNTRKAKNEIPALRAQVFLFAFVLAFGRASDGVRGSLRLMRLS